MEEPAGPARAPRRAPATGGGTAPPEAAPLAQATTRYQDLTLARRLRGNRASFGGGALRRGGGQAPDDAPPDSPTGTTGTTGTTDGDAGTRPTTRPHGGAARRLVLTALVLVLLAVAGVAAAVRTGILSLP